MRDTHRRITMFFSTSPAKGAVTMFQVRSVFATQQNVVYLGRHLYGGFTDPLMCLVGT